MSKEMDIYKFDEMASNVFYKIYPLIAKQIIERTGINDGICVDMGSGGGHLGLALAEITDMKVYLYDKLEDAKIVADKKIKNKSLETRVETVVGDISLMPFEDNSVDLIISRAVIESWEKNEEIIKEVLRVLRPGGKTYIGVGYGSKEYEIEIEDIMIARKAKDWVRGKERKNPKERKREIEKTLKKLSVYDFTIIDDESGHWVIFENVMPG